MRVKHRTPARRMLQGLLAAGAVGWLSVVLQSMAIPIFQHLSGDQASQDFWEQFRGLILLLIIFGIPIACFVALILGWPVWKIAERAGFGQFWHGALWGGLCGALIATFVTLSTVLTANEGTSYSYGDGTRLIDYMVDGSLTSDGWWHEVRNGVAMTATGMLAGYTALRIAWRNTSFES
jgi:hypothetical protein